MEKPIITVFGTAIKTQHWKRVYAQLGRENTIPFELIFAGDKKPDFELPKNFRHIYTTVKPSQCNEIASREASGEYLMQIADDTRFNVPNLLNEFMKHFNAQKSDNVVVMPAYGPNFEANPIWSHFTDEDLTSPPMGVGSFLRTDTFKMLGGIDRRFVGTHWDVDVYMRAREIGGYVHIARDIVASEDGGENKLIHECHGDKALLHSFWVIKPPKDGMPGEYAKKRLAPVEPFEDKDLLTVSQSNCGTVRKWE